MYSVSANYVTAIMSRNVYSAWSGTIVTKSNKTYGITEKNIKLSGSKIQSDAVSGNSLELGVTPAKQLTLQLYLDYDSTTGKYYINNVEVDRYDFYGASVSLTFRLYLNRSVTPATYEDVVMPTFIVNEAKRTSDLLSLVCYDYMKKFAVGVVVADNGTAYDMANLACETCGVELGMTRNELNAFPNGTVTIFPYEAGTYVKTGIALLSHLGKFICANAYIGNDNKLYFRQYETTTQRTISSSWRFKSNFADYETHYAFMSAQDLVAKRTLNVEVTGDTGLKYDLGTNAFLQYGTDTEKRERLQTVLDALNAVTYTPFEVETPIDPSIQIFDILEFTDNQAVSGKKCCVTSISFNLNGSMSIKGVGEDPNLFVTEGGVDSELQELASQIDSKTIYFYNFTNANQIDIADGEEKEICNIRFTTLSSASVIFQLEAVLTTSTTVTGTTYKDLVGKIKYYFNELELTNYYPYETWVDGKHLLHLFFPMDIQTASANHLVVTLQCTGGSVTIPIRQIKSSLYGQSLAATDRWDGNITIRQEIGRIALGHATHGVSTNGVVSTVVVATQVPVGDTFTQEIPQITLGHYTHGLVINGVTDEVIVETNEV